MAGGLVIDVRDLRVARGGTVVLPGLSLAVEAGSVTGLLGPSGSGKTTLMRDRGRPARLRRQRPSLRRRGGRGIAAAANRLRHSGAVRLRRRHGRREPALLRPASGRALGGSARLQTVGLEQFGGRLVSRLSGGQRARVSLATALLNEPPLLVLDEPTVGLDPVLRRDLWATFHRLADAGMTLLVSSDVMGEAAVCDSLLLLRAGELLAAETPSRLLARTGAENLDDAFLRLVEAREEA